ncbi:hypothetical protein BD779DRAFT_1464991 [Infundibulicybe gibba]|nr:hypothetical protein BD779DRAFT_1464991 [Infundibulicybe gibba]
MATRRRIGVSAATTEAARRQLMQPVPCWEKVWVVPEIPSANPSLKQFSDDEGEADEPLAPLPDEPEVVEGDDEMDQDENAPAAGPDATQIEVASVAATQEELPSKPPSPKPQLSMSLQTSTSLINDSNDILEASLKPMVPGIDDVEEKTNSEGGIELDISALGPDGLRLEQSHDLSQMDQEDVLIGAPMMDDGTDPFSGSIDD